MAFGMAIGFACLGYLQIDFPMGGAQTHNASWMVLWKVMLEVSISKEDNVQDATEKKILGYGYLL